MIDDFDVDSLFQEATVIDNLKIERFRGFESYELERLNRVNLLVGDNNSGKTSVLEAVEILSDGGFPNSLFRCAMRRGEYEFEDDTQDGPAIDLRHFFNRRRFKSGSGFEISGVNERPEHVRVQPKELQEQPNLFEPSEPQTSYEAFSDQFALHFSGHAVPDGETVAVRKLQEHFARRFPRYKATVSGNRHTRFVSTQNTGLMDLAQLWDDMVLTEREHYVVEALQIIDPAIERVAFLGESRDRNLASAGIVVRRKGSEKRLPIGSMGDGIKCLLNLSVHLASVPKGFLLVDEIDTGLHFSVMQKMWRLLIQTAIDLDIQVFATTHSLDCLQALARLHEEDEELATNACVHRLEPNMEQSVRHSSDELKEAIDHEMEVR